MKSTLSAQFLSILTVILMSLASLPAGASDQRSSRLLALAADHEPLPKGASFTLRLVHEWVRPDDATPASVERLPTRFELAALRQNDPSERLEVEGNTAFDGNAFCRTYLPKGCVPTFRRISVASDDLLDVALTIDEAGRPAIRFQTTNPDGRMLCRVTVDNIGNRLALVSDNRIVVVGTIETAICKGSGMFVGDPARLRPEQ